MIKREEPAELVGRAPQCVADEYADILARALRAEALAAEDARLAAREPMCAAVKPLEWEPHPMGWIAAPPTGHAYIIDIRIKDRVMFVKGMNPPPQVSNVEAAKAAARADYNARILSAITMRSEAEVRAEAWSAAVEAAVSQLEELAKSVWEYDVEDAVPAIRSLAPPADISAALVRIKADLHAAAIARAERAEAAIAVAEEALREIVDAHDAGCGLWRPIEDARAILTKGIALKGGAA